MSRASILIRYLQKCAGCSKLRTLPITSQQIRWKSDEAKTTDIVVEKEKKRQRWTFGAINWDNLPKKVAQFNATIKEVTAHPSKQRMRGRGFRDDEVLYYFRDKEDFDAWDIVSDKELGGKSWAELAQSENGMTAAFRGFISQRLPRYMLPSTYDQLEEKPYYRGFAKMETMPFQSAFGQYDSYDLTGFNCFEIRLRGEGRKYFFEIGVDYQLLDFIYTAPIHTKGGPDWETVKVPYGKLICSKRNSLTYIQDTFSPSKITCFRFLLLDAIEGPFQLELDYIGLTRDETENQKGSDYWDPHQHTNTMIGTW